MSMRKRPDLTAQPLIPRKEDVQPSAPQAEIELPPARRAQPKPAPRPKPAPEAARPATARANGGAGAQEDRVLNMSFRITARQLLRLKGLALLTGRSQQEVLHDLLEQELNAKGF